MNSEEPGATEGASESAFSATFKRQWDISPREHIRAHSTLSIEELLFLRNALEVSNRGCLILSARLGGRAMTKRTKKRSPKTILKLPDLEHSKAAVLNSLSSLSSRRSYDHAIRNFIDWCCSEPRLAFNRTVVTERYLGCKQRLRNAVSDRIGLEPDNP